MDCYSLSDIWPVYNNSKSESCRPKLKCPTFRSYLFRQLPPEDVSDYFPISIPGSSKFNDKGSNKYSYHYTPAYDPPKWPKSEKESKKSKNTEEKVVVDKLTLNSVSKNSFPLYDFNGDFFLKFMVLECYGKISLSSRSILLICLI